MSDSDSKNKIHKFLSEGFHSIAPCDRAISIFYFYILILVLILAGDLIQEAEDHKPMGWLAFSICVILGILGMILIWTGKKIKTGGVIVINLIIAALLMFAMIYTNPNVPMTQKVGAHFANIGFLLVTIICLVLTTENKLKEACQRSVDS